MKKKNILLEVMAVTLLVVAGCSGSDYADAGENVQSDITILCNPAKVSVGDEVKCDVKAGKGLSVNILQFTFDAGQMLTIQSLSEELGIVFNPVNGKGVLTSVDSINFVAGDVLFTVNLQAVNAGETQVKFSNFKAITGLSDDLNVAVASSNKVVVKS